MKLEPGQRVRCVDNAGVTGSLTMGTEYTVHEAGEAFVWLLNHNLLFGYSQSRFKPVVRVPWVLA